MRYSGRDTEDMTLAYDASAHDGRKHRKHRNTRRERLHRRGIGPGVVGRVTEGDDGPGRRIRPSLNLPGLSRAETVGVDAQPHQSRPSIQALNPGPQSWPSILAWESNHRERQIELAPLAAGVGGLIGFCLFWRSGRRGRRGGAIVI